MEDRKVKLFGVEDAIALYLLSAYKYIAGYKVSKDLVKAKKCIENAEELIELHEPTLRKNDHYRSAIKELRGMLGDGKRGRDAEAKQP